MKTYLRSTTGDSRLNHLTMLNVHKDRRDALTSADVANDFVGAKESREQLFGKFSRTISQTSSLFRQSQHKRKIRDKTRGIVHNCSVCFNRETDARGVGGINVGYSLSPPSHFLLATGLLLKILRVRQSNILLIFRE